VTDATEEMITRLREDDLKHVFVEFADLNGISRSKQVTAEYFLDSWESGFTMNLLLLVQTPRNAVPEGTGLGEEISYGDGLIHPIPETFEVLPWREDAARVLCEFEHDGQRVEAAPRATLGRVLARNDFDFELYVGSELELYLLEETDSGYRPFTDDKHECVSWATEEVSPFYDLVTDWASAYGISLQTLLHEHGAGQLEVLFDYGRPMEQADTTFDFKRLIKQAGRRLDLWPTFMAKPFGDRSGSGYHLHVSAFDGDENVFESGDGLSERGRHFVGGLLEHADALSALGTPNLNGFKRYESGSFAPYTASWGYDNRMVGVRVPSGVTRVENRIASADANPYLVIAATLAAGLHGLREGIEPGEPIERDPAGERPRLPTHPEQALRALEEDDDLIEILGSDVVRAYTAMKRREYESFENVVTDWEREQYVRTL
jgi:glutamine synthetase